MPDDCAPPPPMFPTMGEDLEGRGGSSSKSASKFGDFSTKPDSTPDDCTELLPSADVVAAGVNEDWGDEGIEAASNSCDSWVRDVPLGPLEKLLLGLLQEDLVASADSSESANERGC